MRRDFSLCEHGRRDAERDRAVTGANHRTRETSRSEIMLIAFILHFKIYIDIYLTGMCPCHILAQIMPFRVITYLSSLHVFPVLVIEKLLDVLF